MNMDDEYSDGVRSRPSSLSEGLAPTLGRRRSVGGFIVAAVVLAGVALIGAVWAKDHLGGVLGSKPQPVVQTDPREVGLLAAGEKALADGNLETAKESFDKASALAEKDPRVLVDAARLATIRADVPWLRARLLAADATDDIRLTKDTLGELSIAARKAADDALAVAPEDPAAIRTKVDALRISGDRDAARALVSKVGSSSSQPETAYVLAALDLADPEPLWSTVIERLRVAASAESGPGRARAALTYALARSGEVAAAKAEVDRLAAMSRQHPLLPQLRAFTEHAKPVAKVDVAADGGALATTAGADAGRHAPRVGGGAGTEPALPSDARQIVAQAEAARAKGDYDRALTLYQAAVDRNGGDTEALNGLASVAHARRDLPAARAAYKRVLSINPSYVPALVGAGDIDWESGDRATAMKTYKEIVDRFPEGSYPPRVKQRLESAAPAPAPAPPAPAPPAPTAAPAPGESGGGG
jgi:tetratricopeptide (TPR) repeat protein